MTNRLRCLGGRLALLAFAALSAVALCALAAAPAPRAETVREGNLQVGVSGKLTPSTLPRSGRVPVAVSFRGRIRSTDRAGPPQLLSIKIALNRRGRLTYRGIPKCRMKHISPSTTREAILSCREALVGTGTFSANVKLPEQSPFPSKGKVLAFNGRFKGKPAILAHIFGTKPVPTSYVLPFTISRIRGAFGVQLEAALPRVTGDWGFVTGISMTLDRRFRSGGKSHGYLAADCPAPNGFPGANFPLARASFSFEGGKTLTSTMHRTCRVRR